MFFQDHFPPHFHAEYQDYEAVFEIDTLKIREGSLPNKAKFLVEEWATLHKEDLLKAWEKAQIPELPEKISPLE